MSTRLLPAPVPAGDGRLLLNLGCGNDHHPAFVNVDLNAHPGVIQHDLRQGIPFPDATFDLAYHSTMLSMFRPAEAARFMRECRRVLKAGGVLRVVTEDLEQMCRVYLQKLEDALAGDERSAADYDWMMLELYDQATRERPGGGMSAYASQDPLPSEEFIYSRVGDAGRSIVAGARSYRRRIEAGSSAARPPFRTVVRNTVRKLILTSLLGRGGMEAFDVGRFRLAAGQVTYRMYDRFSLRRLFLDAGFSSVVLRSARESGYDSWAEVNLDLSPRGEVARPHALIMEGMKS
jgi:SAM-dependent methyltransferase